MDLYPFKIDALEGSDIEFIFSAPISPVGVSSCTGCTLKQCTHTVMSARAVTNGLELNSTHPNGIPTKKVIAYCLMV